MNVKLLKILLILLVCISLISTDIFIPALPFMQSQLQTNLDIISLIISSYMLGLSISMLISGNISDMYGRKIVLITTISLYALSSFFIALCNNVYLLILLRFIQGIGAGSGVVVGRLILKDSFKDREQLNMMVLLSAGVAILPAIAPQIGALLIHFFNWQSCFLVNSIIGCVTLWILIFKYKETYIQYGNNNQIKKLPMSFISAFNTKEFTAYAMLVSFAWCADLSFIGLSSFLFQKNYAFSPSQYALIVGSVTASYLLGAIATRTLNKKNFSIQTIIKIGVSVCFLGGWLFAIAYAIQIVYLLIFAMYVIQFGIGLVIPTAQIGAMRCHPIDIGWYTGCLFFTEFVIGSIVLYLAGLLESTKLGAGMTISILFSTLVLVLSAYFLFIENKKSIRKSSLTNAINRI